jgi:hypothetical protein
MMNTQRQKTIPPGIIPALILLTVCFYLTGFIGSSRPSDMVSVTGAKAYVSNLSVYPVNATEPVSAGPVIANAVFSEAEKRATISIEGIPAGTYNRIKLKITGKPASYFDSSLPDMNSVIIFGKHNDADFSFTSDAVIQKDIILNAPVTVGDNRMLVIETNMDINSAFMEDGRVLNPMDRSMSYKIGYNLEKTFSDAFKEFGSSGY